MIGRAGSRCQTSVGSTESSLPQVQPSSTPQLCEHYQQDIAVCGQCSYSLIL